MKPPFEWRHLAKDIRVPALIMTRGDQAFLKMYRRFLMESDCWYNPDARQIDEIFTRAAKGECRRKVGACRYVRVTQEDGFFGTYYSTRIIPPSNGKYHMCPVVLHRHFNPLLLQFYLKVDPNKIKARMSVKTKC